MSTRRGEAGPSSSNGSSRANSPKRPAPHSASVCRRIGKGASSKTGRSSAHASTPPTPPGTWDCVSGTARPAHRRRLPCRHRSPAQSRPRSAPVRTERSGRACYRSRRTAPDFGLPPPRAPTATCAVHNAPCVVSYQRIRTRSTISCPSETSLVASRRVRQGLPPCQHPSRASSSPTANPTQPAAVPVTARPARRVRRPAFAPRPRTERLPHLWLDPPRRAAQLGPSRNLPLPARETGKGIPRRSAGRPTPPTPFGNQGCASQTPRTALHRPRT